MKAFITLLISVFAHFCILAQQQEYLIQLMPAANVQQVINKLNRLNKDKVLLKRVVNVRKGIYLLSSEGSKVLANNDEILIQQLNSMNEVQYAQPNRTVNYRGWTPDDALFSAQWNLEKCQFPAAWEVVQGGETYDGKEMVIAVIDRGFRLDHEDLKGQLYQNPDEIPANNVDDDQNGLVDDILGWDFENDQANPTNGDHGTQVAGILGAETDNTIGIAGAANQVKMMILQAFREDDIAAAYQHVIDERRRYNETNGVEGAFIVAMNGSIGFDNFTCDDFPILRDFFDEMGEVGILYVGATINSAIDIDARSDFPTGCFSDYLVTVTNSTRTDVLDEQTGFGQETIDLAAPGNEVTTTHWDGQYIQIERGGASFSTPLVSAAIALMYSIPCADFANLVEENPAGAASLVKKALLDNVDIVPDLKDKTKSGGRLNVFRSLNYLHGYCIAKPIEREAELFETTYLRENQFLRLYPNPVQNLLQIDYSSPLFESMAIKIFNLSGQLVLDKTIVTKPFQAQTIAIEVQDWAAGAYVLTIVDKEKKSSLLFLKQ